MKNYRLLFVLMLAVNLLSACGGADERKVAYIEKAESWLADGNYDKARIELQNALQIDPKYAYAHYKLGEVHEHNRNYQKAFISYQRAVDYDKNNLDYRAKIGRFYLVLAGDLEKAIEIRDFISANDKNNINGKLLDAGIYLQQGNIDEAKKISKDIYLSQPEMVENIQFLSLLYSKEKSYDESIGVLATGIQRNPNDRSLKYMLANTYQIAGKYDYAEALYKKIIEAAPDNLDNYIKLAVFYREIGNVDKAEETLRNASEVDSSDVQRKLVLVDFIQKNKGLQNAIDELMVLVSKYPEMSELKLALGRLYVAQKKIDDAEKIFLQAISDSSDDSVGIMSRVDLANLYMMNNKVDQAVSVIKEAAKISPNDADVNFVRAKLLLVTKDYDGAIISLRTVLKDNPENIQAYLLLASLHNAKGETDHAKLVLNQAYENNRAIAENLMALSKYHDKNKNYAELEKVIDSVLIIDAKNYDALTYKAKLFNQKERFSEARSKAELLIEAYSDMPSGYIESVPYYINLNEISEAISLLEKGYEKVSDKSKIQEYLTRLYINAKKFNEATEMIQNALKESGESAELYMLLANVQISSNDLANAQSSLDKARNINPDWNEPYLMLANLSIANNQHANAINILQEGLARQSDDLKLSLVLAKVYENMGDYNKAIEVYEKSYAINNSNMILANNLASLLSDHRDDENSLKRAKELADRLMPIEQAVTRDTVGWVYYRLGKYDEALNIIRPVVDKHPDVPMFNYHYGMALYKSGDEAGAKLYLERSVTSEISFFGKSEAEAYLKKLQ
ncbi:MAG: tetratricopeptide repeat protein [Gammaproteobacteria bacterium]|nr:tetratricopeptide repeat protein [Gammaproteobacteria bacterium]